ncbi:histone-lysine N-methyltransferase ATX2-like [Silene latifolia]|uniref:histone-lysine N-methyltransferase ATX2-like n=1 Tax=Silene latifolia TaxID=37657 RepID=UPI003D76AD34
MATVVIEEHHSPDIQPDPISKPSFPEDIDNHYGGSPIKFLPLHHVYSATSPSVISKKVRARKLTDPFYQFDHIKQPQPHPQPQPQPELRQITHVYSRRKRKAEIVVKTEPVVEDDDDEGFVGFEDSKRRQRSSELVKLGVDSSVLSRINRPRLRESRFQYNVTNAATTSKSVVKKRKVNSKDQDDWKLKKWFQLASDGVDPVAFIGLKCKVYWPLDDDWYKATIQSYNSKTKKHNVNYEDGDEEELDLSDEQVKFHVSREEMRKLNLKGHKLTSDDDPDYSLLIGLAATVDESRELEAGDIIWAKLTGHAMWPAVIMDESLVSDRKGLNKSSGGRSLPVQFFGSHDFARVQVKQIVSFVKGLSSCFHLKCKSPRFIKSLKEAKMYLNDQKLPKSMLSMQRVCVDIQSSDSDEISLMDISNSKVTSKISAQKKLHEMYQHLPDGYWPVCITWKDLDRCSVCHMDEEYENNLFLQCDKCRMMVHARCYGEESVSGMLWLCKLCRDGAPQSIPPCRLCPVIGGAMKPTTDGHWAHLACAIWIPETCLSDVKRMEPIDGLRRINKDRWKLICSICHIPYGACIQCSNPTCRVAYHPLCARAAGLCVELENEDRLHLISFDEDEEDQCIRLFSFCSKHKQPSNVRSIGDEKTGKKPNQDLSYNPPSNESGCARCEPYDYSGRRGRKEPEILAAASVKRLYLENKPYLVGGFSQHESLTDIIGSKFCVEIQNRISNQGGSQSILSMADKYEYMRKTFRKRLAFGKSKIHGFGIFAKRLHKAGDMVIEYTGEIVRPLVADRREHFIYNSLVGAGTYMFRIDDDRVIDATRAGSIAHLINHSCEPNCYSRVITVCGDEHIIIFAKRDILQSEELTYDYRFFSIDERLACYCGFDKCRGVVNDIDAEEQTAKLYVPRSELTDWRD